jgi:hypothetical protein
VPLFTSDQELKCLLAKVNLPNSTLIGPGDGKDGLSDLQPLADLAQEPEAERLCRYALCTSFSLQLLKVGRIYCF